MKKIYKIDELPNPMIYKILYGITVYKKDYTAVKFSHDYESLQKPHFSDGFLVIITTDKKEILLDKENIDEINIEIISKEAVK